jgi:YidC/Oxa1 family membrane protein insertase
LTTIHEQVGVSWAWSIVLLTVVVRIAMIPLTVKQQQSFRAMQSLQPQIKKLQAKYKDDRQKLNEEMMLFYRENKVNPFGSCLPLIVQLPIFFALYIVLVDISEEVEAGADLSMFWGWIPNITESLNAMPGTTLWPLMIIYVLSQMGSTLLMPTSIDPKQKYIFLFLPIVFAYFIVSPPFGTSEFPAGLLIYWITTNLWTHHRFLPPPRRSRPRRRKAALQRAWVSAPSRPTKCRRRRSRRPSRWPRPARVMWLPRPSLRRHQQPRKVRLSAKSDRISQQ